MRSEHPDPKSREPDSFVFPKWTNRLRELSVVAAVGGLLYAVVFLTLLFGPDHSAIGYAPEQPVPYSHELHAGQLDIDCRYCHTTVETAAHAAIPSASTCMNCHASVRTDSEKLEGIRRAAAGGDPVRWVRVHDLPDFVYFDHSAHVGGGIGCVSCHGRVDRMEVVRQEKPLNMGWCLDCHRAPDAFIVPREQVTNLAWAPDPGENRLEVGARLYDEHQLTPSTDCSTCHR